MSGNDKDASLDDLAIRNTALHGKGEPHARGKTFLEWGAFAISLLALILSATSFWLSQKQEAQQSRKEAIDLVKEADAILESAPGVQSELRSIGVNPSALIGEHSDCELSTVDRTVLLKVVGRVMDALGRNPRSLPALDRLLFIAKTLEEPNLLSAWKGNSSLDSEARLRIAVVQAALEFDLEAMDQQLKLIRTMSNTNEALVVDAAWSLSQVGRTDEAIALLQQQPVDAVGQQAAFELAQLLVDKVITDPQRANEALRAVRHFGVLAQGRELWPVMLEYDIEFARGNFDAADQLGRKALLETLKWYPQPIPHRWVSSLLSAGDSILSADAQLQLLDAAIASCPSARRTLEMDRIGPLMQMKRCKDAIAAASIADVTGLIRATYEVMIAPPEARRDLLYGIEDRLQNTEFDNNFTPMVIGAVAWSLDEVGRPRRAARIAAGFEDFKKGVPESDKAPELRTLIESEFLGGMSLDAVAETFHTYSTSDGRMRQSAQQSKMFGDLTQLSKELLTESSLALCNQ